MRHAMSGAIASVAAATMIGAARQPSLVVAFASHGRNTSCPVAVLAVRTPITSPRRAVNQRFATAAPSTVAASPDPAPTTNPHSTTNCQ